MRCSVQLSVCLTIALCTGAAFAQEPPVDTPTPTGMKDTPVAYLFVSNYLGKNRSNIVAYSAAADGRLTHRKRICPWDGCEQVVTFHRSRTLLIECACNSGSFPE
jgi:hypothetical protein